jgi:hypothetical protein
MVVGLRELFLCAAASAISTVYGCDRQAPSDKPAASAQYVVSQPSLSTIEPTSVAIPELFICGDNHKRVVSTDRVILPDGHLIVVVRERGKATQVTTSQLAAPQYQKLVAAFAAGEFFALPARIPSEEECGDSFWLMAATPQRIHRSDNDSTESAPYKQVFETCVQATTLPASAWKTSSLEALRALVSERTRAAAPNDARAALLAQWLKELPRTRQ